MRNFKINGEEVGKRLDVFLASALKEEYSRSVIQQAIKDGFALVNNKKQKPSYKLRANDEIDFTPPPSKIPETTAENIPVDIIYEDEDIVVVNKPSGMVVHPAVGNYTGTLVNALLFHTKGKLSNSGSPLRPGVVHRLDKDASGVMVLAKTDAAYKELVNQFKQRSIVKKYIALVKGGMDLLSGKIELPIARSKRDRKKMSVSLAVKSAKPAVTYYKVLEKFKEFTRAPVPPGGTMRDFTKLEIKIETGRTHQIRVHMSYIGHPILGDMHYGGPKAPRLMLHALSLQFKHPVSGKDLYFQAPIPEEFKKFE